MGRAACFGLAIAVGSALVMLSSPARALAEGASHPALNRPTQTAGTPNSRPVAAPVAGRPALAPRPSAPNGPPARDASAAKNRIGPANDGYPRWPFHRKHVAETPSGSAAARPDADDEALH